MRRREGRAKARLWVKDAGGQRVKWYGDKDTSWDAPWPLDELVDCFDCRVECYFWDDGAQGRADGFGGVVERAVERRGEKMQVDLERAGWVEVGGEEDVGSEDDDGWIGIDGEVLLS